MTVTPPKDGRLDVLVILAMIVTIGSGSPVSIPRERLVGEGWIINGVPMSIDHVVFNR